MGETSLSPVDSRFNMFSEVQQCAKMDKKWVRNGLGKFWLQKSITFCITGSFFAVLQFLFFFFFATGVIPSSSRTLQRFTTIGGGGGGSYQPLSSQHKFSKTLEVDLLGSLDWTDLKVRCLH